jgi:hypothetical protein
MKKNSDLLKRLKSTGLAYNLWNSGLLDRIISDYIVSTNLIVGSTSTGGTLRTVAKEDNLRGIENRNKCKYYEQMPVKLLPNCASYKMEKSKLS